jgi:hypothetical protein
MSKKYLFSIVLSILIIIILSFFFEVTGFIDYATLFL